jgi:hypothetical protein
MMRLKRYSKNSASPVPPFLSLILLTLVFSGCSGEIPPTYKEKDIPSVIQKICKDEFNLDTTSTIAGKTLWVYAPISKMIHKDYETTKGKLFDDKMSDQLRNVMISIGRVLISADHAPDFFCLVISDIGERGLDYSLVANAEDIKKSYAGFLPWTEINKRYVEKLESAPQALGDTTGAHIQAFDITLKDFIAAQIAQRIENRFRQEDFKSLYNVKGVSAQFTSDTLVINANIETQEVRLINPGDDNITRESQKIIAMVTRYYEFRDYEDVQINYIADGKSAVFSKAAVEAIKE